MKAASAAARTAVDAAAAKRDNPYAPPNESAGQNTARSLFGEILDWMLAPLLLLWPLSIAATYLIAKSIANEPFDQALETRASVLARQLESANGTITLALGRSGAEMLTADSVDTLYFQVLGAHGEYLAGDRELPLPPRGAPPAPGAIALRSAALGGSEVRIAYVSVEVPQVPGGMALVQVAETTGKRTQLANDIIKGVIFPQFIVLPLAIFLVWFGLARGLAPLHALQANIRTRRPDDLSPLEAARAPPEIAPLVASFNELLTRLEQNMELQQRFIAQAAHQMKTPLAGLRMQAELAQRFTESADVQRSLRQIAASSEQAARLVGQLLSLARAENRAAGVGFETIDAVALVRHCVQQWVTPALAKQMDIGYEEPDAATPVMIDAQPLLLSEMLGNLIDNALRYTPAGGRVTVRLRPAAAGERVFIEVEDTGPGIPVSERARVVERFYRILGRAGEGSGLGLAIVEEIVAAHGGTLSILDHVYQYHPRQAGTLMRVTLPRRPAPPGSA